MIVGDWLAARTPAPPPALRARLESVLGASAASDDLGIADICLTTAERVLVELLRTDCTSREAALDLLTADALVTYAFEAAGASSGEFEGVAYAAMQRLSALSSTAAGAPNSPAAE
jgi:hypothetical protein